MLERACQCVAVVEMVVEMHCSKVSNTSSADDAAAVGAMMNGSVRRMNEKRERERIAKCGFAAAAAADSAGPAVRPTAVRQCCCCC